MPKKQARNAFWYFMCEWKVRQESLGETFPDGLRDVQADERCSKEWQSMTPQQRMPYTQRAKQSKADSHRGKQTGTGEYIKMVRKREQEELDFQLNMDAHIRQTVATAKKYDEVGSLSFLFLHMNWYYMREPDNEPVDFCPAEFAIGEFSLKDGITDYYHEIIRTKLHLGYAREAAETSEKTHRLHWDSPEGEDDWVIIYDKLMRVLKKRLVNDKLPPIYTSKKIAHVIPSLIRRITEAIGASNDMFLIYTIESLFSNVLWAVSDFPDSNIVKIMAETEFEKDVFAYTPGIECDYHKEIDGTSQFCSLSVIRQWAYTFCDKCCPPLGISMMPGIHCPLDIQIKSENKNYMNVPEMLGDRIPRVFSATGVSELHRIKVSERKRDDGRMRESDLPRTEIIDHSKIPDEKLPKRPPSPVYGRPATPPATAPTRIPMRPLREPITTSQALMGLSREVPNFTNENFPCIGGRGMRLTNVSNPPETQRWRVGRQNTDDDSD